MWWLYYIYVYSTYHLKVALIDKMCTFIIFEVVVVEKPSCLVDQIQQTSVFDNITMSYNVWE